MNVFILGSKGIPAQYGGFETFVQKLIDYKKSNDISYTVACIGNKKQKMYKNEKLFYVNPIFKSSIKAIIYDLIALSKTIKYIKKHSLTDSKILILACRIGPFLYFFKRKIRKYNIPIIVNPDGHEWKRSKWNKLVKMYWKYSEKLMIKHADLVVCDSQNIEKYIIDEYSKYHPITVFIPYGADVHSNLEENEYYDNWLNRYSLVRDNYYLIVGRFVPENNFELMITGFIKSNTSKKLVIVSDYSSNNKMYQKLLKIIGNDNRVVFVGTIFNQQLLNKIRHNAYCYLHGHSVGGTNPSLLESLATTKLNLLFDVEFNKEVGLDSAIYFSSDSNDLADKLNYCDKIDYDNIDKYSKKAKGRIVNQYNWNSVVNNYEKVFLK